MYIVNVFLPHFCLCMHVMSLCVANMCVFNECVHVHAEPGITKEKKEEISRGHGGMLPWKILKVETKICAV